jgi:hypothetical protein
MAMWEVDKAKSDFSYRLCLSVNFVWPLLVDQYTESEKSGYRVMIARVMLHELAVRGSLTSESSCIANSQSELACLQL